MLMSLLLLEQIAQLFIFVFLGWLIVRVGLLKTSDSKIISIVVLYLVAPCIIVSSFQVDFDASLLQGFGLSMAAALLVHFLLIFGSKLLAGPLKLTPAERASIIYPVAVSMIAPIVTAMLGREWILYTTPFLMVQNCLLWSHGYLLVGGKGGISLKKIFLNVNVIAVLIGVSLLFLPISFPPLVAEAMANLGDTIGPLNMLVTGMLMAGVDLKATLRSAGVWKTTLLRLVFFPLLVILLFKFSGIGDLVPDGEIILLVTLLPTCAPAVVSITQIAQVYSDEGQHASFINVVTTLLCIITMPLMVGLYQIL